MIKNKNKIKNKVNNKGSFSLLEKVNVLKNQLKDHVDHVPGAIKNIPAVYGNIAEGTLQLEALENGEWKLKKNQLLKLKAFPFMESGVKAFMKVKEGDKDWALDLVWQFKDQLWEGPLALNQLLGQAGPLLGLGGIGNWDKIPLKYGISGGNVWMEMRDFPLHFYGFEGAKASLMWRNNQFSFRVKGVFEHEVMPKIAFNAAYNKGVFRGDAKGAYQNEWLKAGLNLSLEEGKWSAQGKAHLEHKWFKGQLNYHLHHQGKAAEGSVLDDAFFKHFGFSALGKVHFQCNEYLKGDAQMVLDEEGYLSLDGALEFPSEITFLPGEDHQKELFNYKVKAGYGVPLLGQIYLFLGMVGSVKYGWSALSLKNLVASGQWSNHPQKTKELNLGADLHFGAYGGLHLEIEGGAGLSIMGHDIEAALGLNAQASIAASGSVGTSISLAESNQKIQAYFKSGGQLNLQLFGDMGLKIDAPFWSPIPDQEQSLPFGNKNIPLQGAHFEWGGALDVDLNTGVSASVLKTDELDVDAQGVLESVMNNPSEGAKTTDNKEVTYLKEAYQPQKKQIKKTSKKKEERDESAYLNTVKSLDQLEQKAQSQILDPKEIKKEINAIKKQNTEVKIKGKKRNDGVYEVKIKQEGKEELIKEIPVTNTPQKSATKSDEIEIREGDFTFGMEGSADEKSRYFSRKAHWPGGVSGITIGRGYDLAHRGSKEAMKKELTSVGLDHAIFEKAMGLKGVSAHQFLKINQNKFPVLTIEQEQALFQMTYASIKADTHRLMNKKDVQDKYGEISWEALHPVIKEIVVDLRFRGDYSPKTRSFLQAIIVANDLQAFYEKMKDRTLWKNVPLHRFQQRYLFIEKHLKSGNKTKETAIIKEEKPKDKSPKKHSEDQNTYQVTASQLNIRASGDIQSGVVGKLKKGSLVQVIHRRESWGKIAEKQWIHMDHVVLSPKTSKTQDYWVNTAVLNMRSGPGREFPVAGKLQFKDKITIIAQQGLWYQSQEKSWVHSTFLITKEPQNTSSTKLKNQEEKREKRSPKNSQIDISKVGKKSQRKSGLSYVELMQKDRLEAFEIQEVRQHIKTLDEEAQKKAYEKLQEKVMYKNQRNNKAKATEADLKRNSWMEKYGITTAGDLMCNLTAMAMALEYLGISNPDPRHQFEDFLEYYRQQEHPLKDRRNPNTWIAIANDFEVEAKTLFINSAKKEDLLQLQSYLSGGAALLISMFSSASGKGHIVRLQKVESKGLVVDDPYGKIADLGLREKGGSGYKSAKHGDQRNSRTKEEGKGEDQLWTWENLAQTVVKYAVYFN